MASICSISRITCESSTAGEAKSILKLEGGVEKSFQTEEKASSQSGTSLFIKDLFFNTPVRMKFIQSQTSEKNQIKKMLNSFILTHPQVEFNIKWDQEEKQHFPSLKTEDRKTRVQQLFQKKSGDLQLIDFEGSYDGFHARIVIPKFLRKEDFYRFQYIFINERIVNDIQIHKIILNSANSIWQSSESGSYCIFIDVPTDQVDVNVHPNKTTVKIFQAPKLFSLISGLIKQEVQVSKRTDKQSEELLLKPEFHSNSSQTMTYKSFQIDDDYKLENYFEQLDSQVSTESNNRESSCLHHTQNTCLFKYQDKVFLCLSKEIILFHMKSLLRSNPTTTPLLISEPFELDTSSSDKALNSLRDWGFELDRLDQNTVVLRSFPKEFEQMPYQILITNILDQENSSLGPYVLQDGQLRQIIQTHGLAKLIEQNLVTELSDEKLRRLL